MNKRLFKVANLFLVLCLIIIPILSICSIFVGLTPFLFIGMIFECMLGLLYFIILCNSDLINQDDIHIKASSDHSISVQYQDYSFDLQNELIGTKSSLPRYDSNHMEVPFLIRERLRNYLYRYYDTISVPNSEKLIDPDRVRSCFSNLKKIDSEDKDTYIKNKYFHPFMIVLGALLIFIIFNLKNFIVYILEGDFPLDILIVILLLLVFLVFIIYLRIDSYKKDKMKDLYSCKVLIYDKKVVDDGDGGYFYHVRVWDGEVYIINKWFSVSKQFYNQEKECILYVLDDGEHSELSIKKEEE